jgi:hypothetical protein
MLSWLHSPAEDPRAAQVVYRGAWAGPSLQLHYSFDGWVVPPSEVELHPMESGDLVSEPIDVTGRVVLDGAFTDGDEWDNNEELNYRLWVPFDPIDAHLHVSGPGTGNLGMPSLRSAMASMGIQAGIVSWVDNRALSRLPLSDAGLYPLVWVRPEQTNVAEVGDRLSNGFCGIKLHPTVDDYPADTPSLDPYMKEALKSGRPVACHAAPGTADPDHIRALAERFPEVPVILYHTYLGPDEGRRRAVRHAKEVPNLYLETSWCRSDIVLELIDEVGADRVLFGSDASIDGSPHYCRQPPNVDGVDTYLGVLRALASSLRPDEARKVTAENAQQLFGLARLPDDNGRAGSQRAG